MFKMCYLLAGEFLYHYLCYLFLSIFLLNNYHSKHTCSDDTVIERRKWQKLAYHMFTCKFPISYITISADHDIVMMR